MKQFNYSCLDFRGKKVTGSIQAPNINLCKSYLYNKQLKIVDIKESNRLISKLNTTQLTKVIDDKELVDFLDNLAILIASGLRLDDAIEVICQQTDQSDKRAIYFDLYFRVLEGDSLSHAMAVHKKEFPDILVKMIESGEESSSLVDVLESSAKYFKNNSAIKKEVVNMFKMPILYLLATFSIAIFMTLTVFPIYADLFTSLDQEVPAYMQIFIDAYNLLVNNYVFIILIILAVVLLIYFLVYKNKRGRIIWNKISINLPIVGAIIKQYYQAYLSTTLAQLTKNKVNFYDALKYTKPTVKNAVYNELLTDMINAVRTGRTVSSVLYFNPALDEIFIKMVSLGENTGNIAVAFNNLNLYYDKTVLLSLKKLSRRIQPILMFLVYAVVVLLVLAVMLPSLSVMATV